MVALLDNGFYLPFSVCTYLNYESEFYGHRLTLLRFYHSSPLLCSLLWLGYHISLFSEYFMT